MRVDCLPIHWRKVFMERLKMVSTKVRLDSCMSQEYYPWALISPVTSTRTFTTTRLRVLPLVPRQVPGVTTRRHGNPLHHRLPLPRHSFEITYEIPFNSRGSGKRLPMEEQQLLQRYLPPSHIIHLLFHPSLISHNIMTTIIIIIPFARLLLMSSLRLISLVKVATKSIPLTK